MKPTIHYLGILNPGPIAFFMPFIQSRNSQLGFNILQITILVFICLVLALVVLLAYSSARATSRDAKRVSDVEQLQKGLKYFREEFGYYPQASPNYQAVGVDNAFTRFVSPWPSPPTPADGNCTLNTNAYVYEQVSGGESYTIKFCLGKAYGNLKAGNRIVTPTSYQ